jgi:hypothetical protein
VFDGVPTGDFAEFQLTLNYDFATFDCPPFKQTLANEFGVATGDLFFTECYEGSVVLKGYTTPAAISQYSQTVSDGNATLPVAGFFSTGTTSAPEDSGVNIGIIIGAAVGGVLLIAIIVVVIVVLVRRNRGYGGGIRANPTFQSDISMNKW